MSLYLLSPFRSLTRFAPFITYRCLQIVLSYINSIIILIYFYHSLSFLSFFSLEKFPICFINFSIHSQVSCSFIAYEYLNYYVARFPYRRASVPEQYNSEFNYTLARVGKLCLHFVGRWFGSVAFLVNMDVVVERQF